jgi:Mg-chelatase subunit ChlD
MTSGSSQTWWRAVLLPGFLACFSTLAGIVPTKEDVVFVVDNSSAMRQGDDRLRLKTSIAGFLENVPRDARVALILFDENATLEAPFVSLRDGRTNTFLHGLKSIDYKDRFSNSAAALERALHELQSNGRKGAGKSIVLITHGRIDTGEATLDRNFVSWMTDVLAEDAAAARIRIFCIGFSGSAETAFLAKIARRTGGAYYRLTQQAGFGPIFKSLAGDLFARPAPVHSD